MEKEIRSVEDLRFLWQWLWRTLSSGIWSHDWCFRATCSCHLQSQKMQSSDSSGMEINFY